MKTTRWVVADELTAKASIPASGPGLDGSSGTASRAEAAPEEPDAAEPEISVMRNRGLWLAPLLGEAMLGVGAVWLSRCLESVIWSPENGFPALSFVLFAMAYAGLAAYSRLHELFMPRAVVLVGVGALVLMTLVAGGYLMVEGYFIGGLYRLRYIPLVTVPLALFLVRCLLVFRAARTAPSLSRFTVNARVGGDRMRKLRARLRYWMS